MGKLKKKNLVVENTIETFANPCYCTCTCWCGFEETYYDNKGYAKENESWTGAYK